MPAPTAAQLGASIRKLRKTRTDLSSEALAAEIGLHRTTLSMIERGRGNPTWEVLRAIADGMGVEMIEIVGLAGQMPTRQPVKRRP